VNRAGLDVAEPPVLAAPVVEEVAEPAEAGVGLGLEVEGYPEAVAVEVKFVV
jgi:hypothetical protein